MNKIDFKKSNPELYAPKDTPSVIDVPAMNFIRVDGKGNPNDPGGEYQSSVELLYALAYTIKMNLKNIDLIKDYDDYTVPPLEGLWWLSDGSEVNFTGDDKFLHAKDKYLWCSMLRQPEFINEEVFNWARGEVLKKKPKLTDINVRLETFKEGLCVQIMHYGPYNDEPATIKKLDAFITEQGYRNDIGSIQQDGTVRRHHEIYLNDPRKIDIAKMKTILRHPVRKA